VPQITRAVSPAAKKQRIEAEAFLKSLTASVGTSNPTVKSWDELGTEMQSIYNEIGGQLQYEQEMTQALTSTGTSGNLNDSLIAHGMQVIPNDGDANNCFLISVLQHVNNNYGPVNSNFLKSYRQILSDLPNNESLERNTKISAESAAAKTFVNLINLDADPKLDIHVISEVNGAMYVDRLGGMEEVSDARKVFILDKGGHFEAITNLSEHV
jgi:hypothetical protein